MPHRYRRLLNSISLAIVALVATAIGADSPRRSSGVNSHPDRVVEADDETFRPTVMIVKGKGQGSGSVIASVDRETLVLTAAHVVREPGDLVVELHRYNVGAEHANTPGTWPRIVRAEVVAADAPSDVAVIRIEGMVALPYVARLAEPDETPEKGAVVTSVGIDQATHLSSWTARVYGVYALDPLKRGTKRPFLITDHAPEHGRSGGGLYRSDGRLVGLCVGRSDPPKGHAIGCFAPVTSIHRLLRENDLEAAIARSERGHVAADHTARPSVRNPVTTTGHRQSDR